LTGEVGSEQHAGTPGRNPNDKPVSEVFSADSNAGTRNRRGRGHIFGESFGRLFAGGFAPFLMEPHTGSAPIFFGTIFVVVAIGAFIPLAFGRETVGQLETVTEGVPALA
jgi:hypothetical protein